MRDEKGSWRGKVCENGVLEAGVSVREVWPVQTWILYVWVMGTRVVRSYCSKVVVMVNLCGRK